MLSGVKIMKKCSLIVLTCTVVLVACMQDVYAQSGQVQDNRRIVAVETFTSEKPNKYGRAITEKVIEIITKSKRFRVVDRTDKSAIDKELELQKGAAFFQENNTAKQGMMMGADYIVVGTIRNLDLIRINEGGSFGGYRATLSFNMKIIKTETSQSSEAMSFESSRADPQLTPERAVDEAIRTLEEKMSEYFQEEFPVILEIMKVLKEDDGEAELVIISGGKSHGLKVGDEFLVRAEEMLNGSPYYTDIGVIEVTKVVSDTFSECEVSDGEKEILSVVKNKTKHIVEKKK